VARGGDTAMMKASLKQYQDYKNVKKASGTEFNRNVSVTMALIQAGSDMNGRTSGGTPLTISP